MLHLQPLRQIARLLVLLACLVGSGSASAASALTGADLALLNRITWGVNASAAKAIAVQGRGRYLQSQLQPSAPSRLPPEAQAQIDALTISREPMATLVTDMARRKNAANALAEPDQKKAAQQAVQQAMYDLGKQAMTRSVLRDLYSPDQLREQLTWFWMNHFNVHAYQSDILPMIGDYEEAAVRPYALGRFRDLLSATLHHPAMLRYLNNDQNSVGRINENYARELMELHTMGVGSGYTQKDVEELARILTGVGVNTTPDMPKVRPQWRAQYVHAGLFEFNPERHDYGDKVFLGHLIKGRGLGETEEALDILSREPATARFISKQLATYFVADDPPSALVDRMTKTFRRSDGDIAAVLKTMLESPEFKTSLGGKFKDPVHYAISAVRLAYDDKVILNTSPIQGWLSRMAQPFYGREPPDGYPLTQVAWAGPGGMATRFEIARQIGQNSVGLFKANGPPPLDRPVFPVIQNALYFDGLSQTLSARTLGVLDQAASPQDWNALFLSSPEFMRR